jgi:3-oxoacyl-[acyl-carrier-protein] synthase-3
MLRAKIVGTGACVPERLLTNADLEKIVETSDEWITTRTGIKERHVVAPGEKFSDLATRAAERALAAAGLAAADLDMVLVGTVSSDMLFPSTACIVQNNLGAGKAAASDLSAACTGFLYGIHLADGLIQSGKAENVLLVGGEILSRYVDWTDRSTCVLFGDGAGAVVLRATRGGGSSRPANDAASIDERLPFIKMKGNETFKIAVRAMADVSEEVLEEQGFTHDDIQLFIPHQANERIIDAVGKQLKIDTGKVYKNIERYGNTSAASIPIALDECARGGRVKSGDLVLMTAFGAGLTWGAALMRW